MVKKANSSLVPATFTSASGLTDYTVLNRIVPGEGVIVQEPSVVAVARLIAFAVVVIAASAGGGAVGAEWADVFHSFGCATTVLEMMVTPELGDPFRRDALAAYFVTVAHRAVAQDAAPAARLVADPGQLPAADVDRFAVRAQYGPGFVGGRRVRPADPVRHHHHRAGGAPQRGERAGRPAAQLGCAGVEPVVESE